MSRSRSDEKVNDIMIAAGVMTEFLTRFSKAFYFFGGSKRVLYEISTKRSGDHLTDNMAARLGKKFANLTGNGLELVIEDKWRTDPIEPFDREEGDYVLVGEHLPYRSDELCVLECRPLNDGATVLVREVVWCMNAFGHGITAAVLGKLDHELCLKQVFKYPNPILLPGTVWRGPDGRMYSPFLTSNVLHERHSIGFIAMDDHVPHRFGMMSVFR